MIEGKNYIISSDNVFADLEMPDVEERLMRVRLLTSIIMEVTRRGLTRRQIASLLDIPQSRVSHLLEARLIRFSLESLQQMKARLGTDVATSS
jgi:predicted XRE-type DNA-binding protein